MNNFVIGLKRFFTNKNVVTIILVIVILAVLYYGYSSTITKKTDPVNVPVATKEIPGETLITNEDVKISKISRSMLSTNVVKGNTSAVVGQYTKVGVTVPEGSPFYYSWIDTADNIPGNWIEQLDSEAGELGYYMPVDTESTLGNSVLPNSYIDIYMKATADNGVVMFGKLLKDVKVLVVHDSAGNNVFANSEENPIPSHLGIGVNPDMYILLHKTEYLEDVSLIIAPRGKKVTVEGSATVTSSTLRDYVDARTITVKEDEITNKEEETSLETQPTA